MRMREEEKKKKKKKRRKRERERKTHCWHHPTLTRQGKARQGRTGQGRARQGKARLTRRPKRVVGQACSFAPLYRAWRLGLCSDYPSHLIASPSDSHPHTNPHTHPSSSIHPSFFLLLLLPRPPLVVNAHTYIESSPGVFALRRTPNAQASLLSLTGPHPCGSRCCCTLLRSYAPLPVTSLLLPRPTYYTTFVPRYCTVHTKTPADPTPDNNTHA
ncbi:hypothetical protein K504DRAFT_198200 [Pleomassaria siparia CBS 279.74]|uniref:Uncharacterized protein n=1 Tax=Pleomassaria siparia CBS 279.74 TaxID=1314801 RepID=A0A6G1KHH2_9PLEO|nr:hypothetical protein K504DRAFT_198200 [Pleomassaria siparia CBS 279.74]